MIKNKLLIALAVFLVACVLSSVALASAVSAAPSETSTTTPDNGSSNAETGENSDKNDEEGSIDTKTTVATIGHVTIHDVRIHEEYVEVDLTLQRSDIIRINEYHDGGGYWRTYRLEEGTHTVRYEFRESTDEIGVSVKSEREWKNFEEVARFDVPGANAVATLLLGVFLSFILVAAIKLRRDRKYKNGARRIF